MYKIQILPVNLVRQVREDFRGRCSTCPRRNHGFCPEYMVMVPKDFGCAYNDTSLGFRIKDLKSDHTAR